MMILKNIRATKNFVKQKLLKLIKKFLSKDKKLIIIFEGNLGSGKTTIIKEIAKNLNIKEDVKSPTFILWQIYRFKLNKKNFFFHHIDLYRIEGREILKLNLKKALNNPYNLFLIEWGDKIINYLKNHKFLLLKLNILSKNKREINLIEINKNERKVIIN